MPREIDESKLNYNRFPGEHVIAVENIVTIGSRTFHIVENYRDGFNAEKLEQRFSDVLDKYDYIVGDWGHEQLRLRGFFSASRKKMQNENKIDRLEDYINEYCNYGCAYFVLRRIRAKDEKAQAYQSERIFEEKPKRKPKRNNFVKKENNKKEFDNKSNKSVKFDNKKKQSDNKPKQGFVIRTRNENK